MILVKETSPSPGALGAANGLAQFSMCMARAISPAFVRSVRTRLYPFRIVFLTVYVHSALFAVSVDNHILGSYLWVVVMVLLGLVGIKVTARVNLNHEKPTAVKAS
jgi:hypothetical protein